MPDVMFRYHFAVIGDIEVGREDSREASSPGVLSILIIHAIDICVSFFDDICLEYFRDVSSLNFQSPPDSYFVSITFHTLL